MPRYNNDDALSPDLEDADIVVSVATVSLAPFRLVRQSLKALAACQKPPELVVDG